MERFAEREQARAAASEPAAVPAAPAAAMPQAPAVSAPVGEDRVEPLRGLRRRIAMSMEQAWRTVPHIFSMDDIDATELVRARASLNDELDSRGIKLSYMPFFIKACVAALTAHPRFNASLDMERGEIIYRHRYNIGVATATPDGLIVTVVHDADRKGLAEIGEEIASLAGLARERRVSVEQLSHGTFTISNYGSYGGLMGTPSHSATGGGDRRVRTPARGGGAGGWAAGRAHASAVLRRDRSSHQRRRAHGRIHRRHDAHPARPGALAGPSLMVVGNVPEQDPVRLSGRP